MAVGGSGVEVLKLWRGRPCPRRPAARNNRSPSVKSMPQEFLLNREFLLAHGYSRARAPALLYRSTFSAKGKGQSDFSDWPLFNAGNDLRSHTLGACSTIGPAGLNLRRLEGVSERSLRAGAFCRNPERSSRTIAQSAPSDVILQYQLRE